MTAQAAFTVRSIHVIGLALPHGNLEGETVAAVGTRVYERSIPDGDVLLDIGAARAVSAEAVKQLRALSELLSARGRRLAVLCACAQDAEAALGWQARALIGHDRATLLGRLLTG